MMIGYDIYDCFTMEHFRLRQRMTLTTKIYCSRLYLKSIQKSKNHQRHIFLDDYYRQRCLV
jgi:thiosulfate reductase cytochrome b subunit